MPRQANGNYLAPANTAAISGGAISSTAFNTLETDIGTEITNSLDRLGRSAMQANLPMGGNKVSGAADPTVSTDLTTKAYVDALVAAFFSTGDGKITLKTTPDTGWIMYDDGTFGSGSSGASNRANADTLALFTLFFNISDSAAPLLTSGGGATTRAAQVSAAAAWAANCRMTLTKQLGRAIAVAGAGSGLTSRALGANLGEENHLLSLAETPAGISSSGTFPLSVTNVLTNPNGGFTAISYQAGATGVVQVFANGAIVNNNASVTASGSVTSANTGGGTHNNMQPTGFWNVMVKL